MAISDKITSIQNHLKDDWDSVESLIGDTDLDKNIENISAALDDLYNDLPKVTGSGASITLDDTRKGRLESTLSGNTSQFTTTGKNLYPTDFLPVTEYGITISKNANGDIVLNGTPNFNEGYKTFYTGDVITVEAGTYTLSVANKVAGIGCVVGGFNGGCNLTLSDTVTSKTAYADTPQNVNPAINIRYDVGTLTNFVLNPQMEKSSSATTYEPFTNGASPNPDYPQEVHVVSGDNKITVCSKNLVNANFSSNTINGVTQIGVNNVITLNGANNKAHSFDFPNTITYEPNTTYTTHVKIIGGSFTPYKQDSNWAVQLYNLNGVSNITLTSNNFNSIFQYSFNEKTTIKPRLWFGWEGTSRQGTDGVFDNLQIQIMVVKGAYSLSDYPTFEPFDGDYYPINLPVENQFDDSTTTNILIADDGTEQTNNAIKTSIYIKVEPNTLYTCSSKLLPNKTSGWLKFSYYDASKNYLSYLYTDNTIRTITIPNNCGYIRIGYHTSIVNDVQFEKGSKSNSYTPFGTTPIELGVISTYKDKLFRTSGKNLFDSSITPENYYYDNNGEKVYQSGVEYINQEINNVNYTSITISFLSSTGGASVRVCEYNLSGAFITRTLVNTNNQVVNLNNATTKIILSVNSDSNSYFTYLMVNKGTTAADYEPYGSGEWYLHKEIWKAAYNGTEPFGYSDSGVSGIKMISKILNDMATGNYLNGFSNYFKNNMSGKNANTIRLGANDKSFYIYINESDFVSVDAWKTWLTTHNTNIYYILATPTNTKITYEPLLEQLEAYYHAKSRATQTNISQENNDLPFEIDASALEG